MKLSFKMSLREYKMTLLAPNFSHIDNFSKKIFFALHDMSILQSVIISNKYASKKLNFKAISFLTKLEWHEKKLT